MVSSPDKNAGYCKRWREKLKYKEIERYNTMDEQGNADAGDIARLAAKAGRECGKCSMCCYLTDVPDTKKPKNGWCPHCRPSENGGCTIYNDRPEICRRYTCRWLVNKSIPDHWYPAHCNMMMDFLSTGGGVILRVRVHPKTPNRWLEEPYFSDLKKISRHGLVALPRFFYKTAIVLGTDSWKYIVMPNKYVPFSHGVVIRVDEDDSWEFLPTKSIAEQKRLETNLIKLQRKMGAIQDAKDSGPGQQGS